MLRIWGRVQGETEWQAVTTDVNGDNSYVYVTNLAQVIQLSPNESPFFANYGIPATLSIIQQIQPDLDMIRTQRQFANFFASLILTKVASVPDPIYRMNVLTKLGAVIQAEVPI